MTKQDCELQDDINLYMTDTYYGPFVPTQGKVGDLQTDYRVGALERDIRMGKKPLDRVIVDLFDCRNALREILSHAEQGQRNPAYAQHNCEQIDLIVRAVLARTAQKDKE